MGAHDVDTVLISNPNTFRYFTDHLPLLSVSPTRTWYLLVPAVGEPIVCIPSIGRDDFLYDSWIETCRTWKSPNAEDEGRSTVITAIQEISAKRIGVESGREMRPSMPLADYDAIRTSLPDVSFTDASALIWSLRSIKDATEVQSIKRVIAAVQAAFAELPHLLRPGITEHEAARQFTLSVMHNGADAVPYLACGSGPGGYSSLTRAASSRALEDGDIIGFDLGATVDGYWCDFDRNFMIGTPPAQTVRALSTLDLAVSTARQKYRPHTPVATLRTTMEAVIAQEGFRALTGSGRWGHGVGLDFTEPPSVGEYDDAVLQPGMVVTLEPLIIGHLADSPSLGLVAEEMFLVTDIGNEWLTEAPSETS
jgi:Xaa-Pro dipeptidase